MVKRTLVVLGVLSLMLVAAGTSSAFFVGWPGGDCGPRPASLCIFPWTARGRNSKQ